MSPDPTRRCFDTLPWYVLATLTLSLVEGKTAERQLLERELVHLRSGTVREWSEFLESAQGNHLERRFQAAKNEQPCTLSLRQVDVKQTWRVTLNGKKLGDLVIDENDMSIAFPIPADVLVDGENVLRIEPANVRATVSDDIRVGQLTVDYQTPAAVLNEATVEVRVIDRETSRAIPCRLTIIRREGTLAQTGATSGDHLAVRPGIIYSSTGFARFGLPTGEYTVYAGRGFEYSIDNWDVALGTGDIATRTMSIRREVPSDGYVACDTHVHTVTYSGHGDATIDERMITLAGEGIELPIATDHNLHIDFAPHARRRNVESFFTPVTGNEVTTSVGHFNIFPIQNNAPIPDHKLRDWSAIFDSIYATPQVRAVILNHARDLHSNTRPFGPKLHNALVGENLDGWPIRFNAMEVVNSAAVQTDSLRLFHDWMGMLNGGHAITPVGSSDSHDVGRHFVGQGRTYIRCDDRDPGNIDVQSAVTNFVAGRVVVSYGLFTELTVDDQFRSGDLARPTSDSTKVAIRVLAPHWLRADRIRLYANGTVVRDEAIRDLGPDRPAAGVSWEATWTIPRPKHDVHLVALATGPGEVGMYWRPAKPYQPLSPDFTPQVIGCSGAVWIDGDGDGRRASARDYAAQVDGETKGDLQQAVKRLSGFDESVAAQFAHRFRSAGGSLQSDAFQQAIRESPPHVQRGFRAYLESWRENEIARAAP